MFAGELAVWFGIAVGTLVGLPVAPLYLAAGALGGLWALPWVMVALVVQFLLAYVLAGKVVRPWWDKALKKYPLPDAKTMGPIKLIIVTRCIPGLPLFIQSYFLSLCRVPLGIYIGLSLIIQTAWAAAFILMGKAVVSGQWVWLASGVGFAALLYLLLNAYARKKS